MGRPKKSSVELGSIEECTAAMDNLLTATLQLESMIADRDLAVAQASATYEAGIDKARASVNGLTADLKAYYYNHLTELEKDGKKSVQLASGVMGRRDNPEKLALKNKSWTWGAVLVLLRERFGDRFLRTLEPEINKDLVKAEMTPETLAECGMKKEQDEKFYAEPARLPEAE